MQSVTSVLKDQDFNAKMKYFDTVREEDNFETVWSIYEVNDINDVCPIKVAGKQIKYETVRPDATYFELQEDIKDGGQRSISQYTTFVGGNTWLNLWKAAESLIKQSGTHHRYIEDFKMCDDGTIELITGS